MQRDAEYAFDLPGASHIRAEQMEEPIWAEVKQVIQNPHLIVAGIDSLGAQESGGFEAETAQAERDLRSIQLEEDRAIRLFTSGKITEAQLDHCRARQASRAEKRELMEAVISWAREVGHGLDDLAQEQRQQILQMVVEQVIIDRDNNVDITLAISVDDAPAIPNSTEPQSPQPDSVAIASAVSSFQFAPIPDIAPNYPPCRTLRYTGRSIYISIRKDKERIHAVWTPVRNAATL